MVNVGGGRSVDTRATIAAEANALGSTIPILDDEAQTVVRDLGFTQTGEAIIIDPAGWKIIYRGPVSALAAQDPDARYLLFNAVVHAVGHRPIEEPKVAVKGAKLDGAVRNERAVARACLSADCPAQSRSRRRSSDSEPAPCVASKAPTKIRMAGS